MNKILDCAVIGGGPAGLAAAIYAARGGLKNVVVFEKIYPGGQIVSSSEIENYPGFNDIKSGIDFMDSWVPQAVKFGAEIKSGVGVKEVSKADELFKIVLDDDVCCLAKTAIIATGTKPKKAGFEGESEFFGKGVGVCAVCDGFFYKNKEVAVIGGGDSAVEESYFLSGFCSKVYLLVRASALKAAPHSIQRAIDTPNIEIIYDAKIVQALGDESGLNKIIYSQNNTNIELPVSGVFVFVGRQINNECIKTDIGFLCDTDASGKIIVDLKMQTNIDGLFAAGDVRIDALGQVICAAGDGATAASSAIRYLHNKK